MDVGWLWGRCGVDVGWMWSGCGVYGGVPSGLPEGSFGVPLQREDLLSKVVQKGDWANVLDYDEVPLLPAKKKRSALKVLSRFSTSEYFRAK